MPSAVSQLRSLFVSVLARKFGTKNSTTRATNYVLVLILILFIPTAANEGYSLSSGSLLLIHHDPATIDTNHHQHHHLKVRKTSHFGLSYIFQFIKPRRIFHTPNSLPHTLCPSLVINQIINTAINSSSGNNSQALSGRGRINVRFVSISHTISSRTGREQAKNA